MPLTSRTQGSALSAERNQRVRVYTYLSRLRRGYTFQELATRWDISRQTASTYIDSCRQVLVTKLCCKYLFWERTRQEK